MSYKAVSVNDWLWEFVSEENKIISENTKNRFSCWLKSVSEAGNYDFIEGVPGGAWLLLFLVKFEFLELDISDYFVDIDDNVYRYTKNLLAVKKDVNSMISLTHYYQMRLTVHDKMSPFRREALFICFNALIAFFKIYLLKEDAIFENRIEIILRLSSLRRKLLSDKSISDEYSYAITRCLDVFRTRNYNASSGPIEEPMALELLKLGIAIKNFGNPIWFAEIDELVTKGEILDKWNSSVALRPYLIAYSGELKFNRDIYGFPSLRNLQKQQIFDVVTLPLFSDRFY